MAPRRCLRVSATRWKNELEPYQALRPGSPVSPERELHPHRRGGAPLKEARASTPDAGRCKPGTLGAPTDLAPSPCVKRAPAAAHWMPIEGDQTLPLEAQQRPCGRPPGAAERLQRTATGASDHAQRRHHRLLSSSIAPARSIPASNPSPTLPWRAPLHGGSREREHTMSGRTQNASLPHVVPAPEARRGQALEEKRLSASRFGVYRLGAPSSTCCCWAAQPGGTSQDRRLFAVQETPL